jgi:hypothetical protein
MSPQPAEEFYTSGRHQLLPQGQVEHSLQDFSLKTDLPTLEVVLLKPNDLMSTSRMLTLATARAEERFAEATPLLVVSSLKTLLGLEM